MVTCPRGIWGPMHSAPLTPSPPPSLPCRGSTASPSPAHLTPTRLSEHLQTALFYMFKKKSTASKQGHLQVNIQIWKKCFTVFWVDYVLSLAGPWSDHGVAYQISLVPKWRATWGGSDMPSRVWSGTRMTSLSRKWAIFCICKDMMEST